MQKINPGSNRYKDNDARTYPDQMQDIPEPKMVDKNKFQCPVCNRVFDSREDYISHSLTMHEPNAPAMPEPDSTTT